jgi:hypothetical protein
MHCVVAWEIKVPPGDERIRLEENLKECLKGYSWVRPVSALYIVKIRDETDLDSIRTDLLEVCQANQGKVNVIMSPAMIGGRYRGWLPKDLWSKIRQRTE